MKEMKEELLCGYPVGHSLYPKMKRRRMSLPRLRAWTLWAMVLGTGICILVNALVGGAPWVFYVLLSDYVFYTAFLSWQTVEGSLIQKLLGTGISVCALLLLAEWFDGGAWASRLVVPIVFFGILCVNALVYFLNFKTQRQNVIPLMTMLGVALLAALLGAFYFKVFSWAWIVLLGVSGALVVVWLIWFRRPVLMELKKKLHS